MKSFRVFSICLLPKEVKRGMIVRIKMKEMRNAVFV